MHICCYIAMHCCVLFDACSTLLCSSVFWYLLFCPLLLDACCGWPCPALFSPPSDLQRSLPVLNPNCIPLFPVWAPRLKIALFGLGHSGNVPIQSTLLLTMTESIWILWCEMIISEKQRTIQWWSSWATNQPFCGEGGPLCRGTPYPDSYPPSLCGD